MFVIPMTVVANMLATHGFGKHLFEIEPQNAPKLWKWCKYSFLTHQMVTREADRDAIQFILRRSSGRSTSSLSRSPSCASTSDSSPVKGSDF